MIDIYDHPPYIYTNESITVPVIFSSKPRPDDQDVVWTIHTHNDTIYIQPGMEDIQFKAYPTDFTENEDDNEFVASLLVKNLASDATIVCNIKNEFGDVSQQIQVTYSPPLRWEDVKEQGQENTYRNVCKNAHFHDCFPGIALWIILLIVGIIVVLILCGMFVGCSGRAHRKQKRRTEENEQFKDKLKQYMAQNKKSNGGVGVNLDEIPDQSIPMLTQGIAQKTGLDPNFHRSMSNAQDHSGGHKVDSEISSISSSITPVRSYNS